MIWHIYSGLPISDGVEVWTCHLQWGTSYPEAGPLWVSLRSAQAFIGLPLQCLSQGELTWFGKFTLGCPAPSERVASTYHLSSTPPHTPTHIPTGFGEDSSTLVFPGVVTLGLIWWPHPAPHSWSWRGHISCPPKVRDLPYSALRWAMCSHCLPKRADPCLRFGFLKGTVPGTGGKGLSSSLPWCHHCNPGEAVTPVPLTAGT